MKISPISFYNYQNKSTVKPKVTALSQNYENTTKLPSFQGLYPNIYRFDIYSKYRFGGCEDIAKYLNLFLNFEDSSMTDCEMYKFAEYDCTLQRFASNMHDLVHGASWKSGGMTNEEFLKILNKIEFKSLDEIKANLDDLKTRQQNVTISAIKLRREFIEKLKNELLKLDPNEKTISSRDADDFMFKIAQSVYDAHNKEFEDYNREIKSKLQYSEIPDEIELLNLEEEIKKAPEAIRTEIFERFGGDYEKLKKYYVGAHCTGSNKVFTDGIDIAIMQMLPRYCQNQVDQNFEISPMSRRLGIDNYEEFLKQFKVGEIYSYPKTQSCAKTMKGAENWFNDGDRCLNVIFRIHPKSKLTKAYDVKDINVNAIADFQSDFDDSCDRYFNSEVIYPPNAKFKVLGMFEKITSNYQFGSEVGDYYKLIIDLQEI